MMRLLRWRGTDPRKGDFYDGEMRYAFSDGVLVMRKYPRLWN